MSQTKQFKTYPFDQSNVKVGDEVYLRLQNSIELIEMTPFYDTWFKVLFIDNDSTFIGELTRKDVFDFELYKKGEHVKLPLNRIQHVLKESDTICYKYNNLLCTYNCTGLCKESY